MSEKLLSTEEIKLPITKKGIKTRNKLLETAEEVFGTKGYFNASVTDITQLANVAQGTFYNYFASKQMIFEELVKKLNKDFRYEIRLEVAKANSSKEAQMIGIKTFFRWVNKHRNLYNIVQQSVLVNEDLYRWYYERIAQGYVKGLKEAMERGEFKVSDPETIAYCLMGASQFIGMRWVYWGKEEVPDYVYNDAMNFIFKGIES